MLVAVAAKDLFFLHLCEIRGSKSKDSYLDFQDLVLHLKSQRLLEVQHMIQCIPGRWLQLSTIVGMMLAHKEVHNLENTQVCIFPVGMC